MSNSQRSAQICCCQVAVRRVAHDPLNLMHTRHRKAMCTISGQLADRRMCNAGVKFTKAALANQFGAGNADAALSFAAASVTLTGSVSGAVNRASPPISITASSVFVVQQLVCSNNEGVNQCHDTTPAFIEFPVAAAQRHRLDRARDAAAACSNNEGVSASCAQGKPILVYTSRNATGAKTPATVPLFHEDRISKAVIQPCHSSAVDTGAACMQITSSAVNMSSTTIIGNTVNINGAAVVATGSSVAFANNTVFQTNNAT